MTAPTLTSFAAPGGGAVIRSGRPFANETAPTLASFAAPGGGAVIRPGQPFANETAPTHDGMGV